MNGPLWWVPILIAFVSGLPGLYAVRASIKANQAAEKDRTETIESAAWARAKTIYDGGIAEFQRQLDALKVELNDERNASSTLRKRVAELEATIQRLRDRLAAYERTI